LRRKFYSLLCVLALAATAFAGQKQLLNLDVNGAAIQGYDPVAFFTDGKAVKGTAKIQSVYKGARYWFATAEHKKLFDSDPAKYEPQFGGYCAYGMSQGHTAPIKIEAWQIVDGRLLMQYDLDVKDKFNKKQKENLLKADENWPKVLEKEGK